MKKPLYDFDNGEHTIRIDRNSGEAWVMATIHDDRGLMQSAKWIKIEEATA